MKRVNLDIGVNMKDNLAYVVQRTSKVTGLYYNVPFSGIVTEAPQWLPDNSDTVILNITLNSPILVFGRERNSIQLRYSSKLDNHQCFIKEVL